MAGPEDVQIWPPDFPGHGTICLLAVVDVAWVEGPADPTGVCDEGGVRHPEPKTQPGRSSRARFPSPIRIGEDEPNAHGSLISWLRTTSIDGERILSNDLHEAKGMVKVVGKLVEMLLDLWITWCELGKRDQVKPLRDRRSDRHLIECHKSNQLTSIAHAPGALRFRREFHKLAVERTPGQGKHRQRK